MTELCRKGADLKRRWEILDQIVSEVVVETDQPDRVKWEGVWYDGPLATAYLTTLRAIQKMARAAIASCDTRPQGGDATEIAAPASPSGAVDSEAVETPNPSRESQQ